MGNADRTADDEYLIGKVRALAAGAVDPAAVDASVGRAALVNTSKGFSLDALRRVTFAPEPDHASEPLHLDTAVTVVYWARPIEADAPHVVGIQIDAAGLASIFFAVVLPP